MSQKMPYSLILASTSRYRANLLSQAGLQFNVKDPQLNENNLKDHSIDPRQTALALAQAKCQTIFSQNANCCVIGCDQVVSLNGQILGKPLQREAAINQIRQMNNKVHEIITAISVMSPDNTLNHVDITRMHMRQLNDQQITRYIDYDKPFDCAGSYKLESAGITLFKKIESEDQTAIIGLPMLALITILTSIGFDIP